MSVADIVRIPSGTINQVNDLYIGSAGAPNGGPLRSHFAGQLGKWWDLDDSDIVYQSTVGVVYGGRFQYVRLAAAAVAPVLGQILFWDTTVLNSLYQVTSDEALSSVPDSLMIAGINLNPSWTPGYYGVIQILGNVNVKFVASLTTSGAIGIPVYASAAGGASVGLADVITTDSTAVANAKFLGKAIDAPVSGATSLVALMPQIRMF